MKIVYKLAFAWKNSETGHDPEQKYVDELIASAKAQAYESVLMGETKGRLVETLDQGGDKVKYVGEWTMEPDWSLRSKSAS